MESQQVSGELGELAAELALGFNMTSARPGTMTQDPPTIRGQRTYKLIVATDFDQLTVQLVLARVDVVLGFEVTHWQGAKDFDVTSIVPTRLLTSLQEAMHAEAKKLMRAAAEERAKQSPARARRAQELLAASQRRVLANC